MSTLATFYDFVLGIHVIAVVAAFGVTFALPLMYSVAARRDPRSLPLMHRVEYTIERMLVNPGLLLVLIAGIYLASDGKHWSEFFVQWGLVAVVVIGAIVGAILIPTAKKAEALAERDLASGAEGPEGMSSEYRELTRRQMTFGTLTSLIVVATVLIMAVKP
ncbi:MAG TPA: DUF2269 family protein [Solirubrobacteraceae bacterium]